MQGGRARRRPCLATTPGARRATKGIRDPADPPTVDEIIAVLRHAAHERHGWRLHAMIVVLWRTGLRIQEALARGGVPLNIIQRQVGHSNLGTTPLSICRASTRGDHHRSARAPRADHVR
jgi:integrase